VSSTTWPEGVIGRYLTVGGATVDITCNGDNEYAVYTPACTGCGHSNSHWSEYPSGYTVEVVNRHTLERARAWAQSHAESCRAMPNPSNA
jgi:hypothetical protein